MSKYEGYTPGPWNMYEMTLSGCKIKGPNGEWICLTRTDHPRPEGEDIANAKLIADAPMLAEQNEKMLEYLRYMVLSNDCNRVARTKAYALIAEIEEKVTIESLINSKRTFRTDRKGR